MVDRASDTLTQAFMNEHGFIDTLPDDAKRERALRDLWPPTIRYCLHYGTVLQTPHTVGHLMLGEPRQLGRDHVAHRQVWIHRLLPSYGV